MPHNKMDVQMRRELATGRPVLFLRNWRKGNPRDYWTEGYSHVGKHFECSDRWRIDACTIIRAESLPDDAAALLRKWNALPGGIIGVPVNRLNRPKGE